MDIGVIQTGKVVCGKYGYWGDLDRELRRLGKVWILG